jgi:ferric-chelate reductase
MAIPHSISNPVFVFHIDVVLLSLFALYVALTLPRALVRLFQPSELLNGFFLRSGKAPAPTSHHRSGTRSRSGLTRNKPIRSTSTRTNQTGGTLVDLPEDGIASEWVKSSKAQRPALIIAPRGNGNGTRSRSRSRSHQSAPSPRRGPTRVPRWTTILHPTLAYALNFRVAPGFSFGKLLVLLVYAGIMIYASLCGSDPFSDSLRTGYVAISQIPIAVALAGKTNWLSWACGVGYEKVWVFFRCSSILCSKRQR